MECCFDSFYGPVFGFLLHSEKGHMELDVAAQ